MHGGDLTPIEGEWDGDLVVIEFPSVGAAKAWYDDPAYQAILALRVDNSRSIAGTTLTRRACTTGHRENGTAAIVEGVPAGYQATDKLARLIG